MKHILILSASTGAGHTRAGEALKESAKYYAPNITVRHIDMATILSSPARHLLIDSYNTLAGRYPNAWGWFYRRTQNEMHLNHAAFWPKLIHRIDGSPLRHLVRQLQPDGIVTTHFFAGILFKTAIPTATIITDYAVHPFWLMGNSNLYFVSTDEMRRDMIVNGIAKERVHITGIPINPVFYVNKPIEKPERKTILFLSGGYGLIRIDRCVRALCTQSQPLIVISIAGRNKKLKTLLSGIKVPTHIEHQVIGWTDTIEDSMRAADIIIGKPGGLTITESVALKKPFIAINPIPGHEDANVRYLEKNGYGTLAKNMNHLVSLVQKPPAVIAPGYKNTPTTSKNTPAAKMIWETLQNGLV